MKILQVIPTYAPAWRYGGPIRAVHEMSQALVRRGHEVHVYTTDLDGPERLPVETGVPILRDGVTVRYFASARPRRMHVAPEMSRALSRWVGDFDVVHLHSVFLWPTAVAARAARRAGVPYVVSPRGMLVKDLVRRRSRIAKETWIRLVERRTFESAAAVHVTSDLEREELGRFGFRMPRVSCIPNGVEIPREASGAAVASRTRDVLFIGRLHAKKRVDLLLRALAAVPGVTATIVGPDDGELATLRSLATSLGLNDRVNFSGPVYDAAKSELFRGHRTLAITSIRENFGNVVLEAMAHGLPVVATDQVGASEQVLRHGAGIVCSGTTEDVSYAIRSMLENESERRATGDRARAAARRYSWDAIAGVFEGLLTKVSGDGNRDCVAAQREAE